MKQMVYVVLDNGEVVGVYNKYADAEKVATITATITPVMVDKTDDCRVGCNTPAEVVEAMEHELSSAPSYPSYPSEDEDEDEEEDDYDEDEDWDEEEDEEEEDEDDPIDSIIYELDDAQVISKEDAELLLKICIKNTVQKSPLLPTDMLVKLSFDAFEKILEKWGVEGIDTRE